MRQHILLPTDFSENAFRAALYAIQLYAPKACTFYFLHSWTFVNTGGRTYISPSYIDSLKDASKAQLSAFKDRAKSESNNSDHEFESIFSVDILVDAIKSAIEKHHIDLVVMGTKGATGAKEFLLGSNSVTVINKMRLCPLILVPHSYTFEPPKQIAFATDFNRAYGKELERITDIATLHQSKIDVLHVNGQYTHTTAQKENIHTLTEFWKTYPHHIHYLPETATKEEVIAGYIAEHKISLLSMVNYKHSFIENLLNEPIIKKMGFHSAIPFMVIPHDV